MLIIIAWMFLLIKVAVRIRMHSHLFIMNLWILY